MINKISCNNRVITTILIFCITVIPTLFTGGLIYRINTNSSAEFTAEKLESIASKQMDVLIAWKEAVFCDIEMISGMDFIENFTDDKKINELLNCLKFNRPIYREIYIIDKNGKFHSGFIKNKDELLQSSHIKMAFNGQKAISEVNKNAGEMTVDIVTPIVDNKEVIGVVCGRINLNNLRHIMDNMLGNDKYEAYIVDKNGVFLTESRFSEGSIGKKSIDLKRVKTNIDYSTTTPYKNYRGIDVLGIYKAYDEIGWTIIVEQEIEHSRKMNKDIVNVGGVATVFQVIGLVIYKFIKENNEFKEVSNIIDKSMNEVEKIILEEDKK